MSRKTSRISRLCQLAGLLAVTLSLPALAAAQSKEYPKYAGLHPTVMAFYGNELLVANTYSDNISVINTATNVVARTIDFGLPIGVPGEGQPAHGAAPNSIAVDPESGPGLC